MEKYTLTFDVLDDYAMLCDDLCLGFGDVLCVPDADRCKSLRSQERLLAPLLERCPVLLNRANWAQESKQSCKKTRSLGPLSLEHSRTTLSTGYWLNCVDRIG
jgi:hypothetical protein